MPTRLSADSGVSCGRFHRSAQSASVMSSNDIASSSRSPWRMIVTYTSPLTALPPAHSSTECAALVRTAVVRGACCSFALHRSTHRNIHMQISCKHDCLIIQRSREGTAGRTVFVLTPPNVPRATEEGRGRHVVAPSLASTVAGLWAHDRVGLGQVRRSRLSRLSRSTTGTLCHTLCRRSHGVGTACILQPLHEHTETTDGTHS